MAELEAEHERISNLPTEKPKVRRVGIGKTFRQWWNESDDEQRHSYLKTAGVSALMVRAEDYPVELPRVRGIRWAAAHVSRAAMQSECPQSGLWPHRSSWRRNRPMHDSDTEKILGGTCL
jgi:hypothetical protein